MKKIKAGPGHVRRRFTSQNPTRSEDSCGLARGGLETPGTSPSTVPGVWGAQVLDNLNGEDGSHPRL